MHLSSKLKDILIQNQVIKAKKIKMMTIKAHHRVKGKVIKIVVIVADQKPLLKVNNRN